MNTVDILVLVVLLLNGALGAYRGFVWQAFRIGSLVLALWLGNRYSATLADGPLTLLQSLDQTGRRVVAWVVILVAAYAVMHLIGHWLRKLIDKARLTSADRSLGFLVGGLKGALFVSLAFQVLLIFFAVLPTDVIVQLRGGPGGQEPPPSQAFLLHTRMMADRLADLLPEAMKEDTVRGLASAARR